MASDHIRASDQKKDIIARVYGEADWQTVSSDQARLKGLQACLQAVLAR